MHFLFFFWLKSIDFFSFDQINKDEWHISSSSSKVEVSFQMIGSPFPHYALGTVVHGFGRGSKELGCPTGNENENKKQMKIFDKFSRWFLANFDEETVDKLPETIYQGVYYGWAQLLTSEENNHIYKMVTSVGTNPFYHGERKTMVKTNWNEKNFSWCMLFE